MSQSASDAKEYVKDVLSSDKDTSTGAFEDIHESVLGKASEATGELGEATEGLKEWAKSAALDIDSDRGHGKFFSFVIWCAGHPYMIAYPKVSKRKLLGNQTRNRRARAFWAGSANGYYRGNPIKVT